MKPVSVQRSLESAGRLTAALLARGAVKHYQYSSNFRETLLILVMSETDKNTNNSSGSVEEYGILDQECVFSGSGDL